MNLLIRKVEKYFMRPCTNIMLSIWKIMMCREIGRSVTGMKQWKIQFGPIIAYVVYSCQISEVFQENTILKIMGFRLRAIITVAKVWPFWGRMARENRPYTML